jgi:SAM-dependent methyltransferase
MKEIYRVLKPHGFLIVSTPNATSLSNVIKSFASHARDRIPKICKNIEIEEKDTGTEKDHIYLWNVFTLFRLLSRCGFKYVDHKFVRPYLKAPKFTEKGLNRMLGPLCEVVILKVRK